MMAICAKPPFKPVMGVIIVAVAVAADCGTVTGISDSNVVHDFPLIDMPSSLICFDIVLTATGCSNSLISSLICKLNGGGGC